MSRKKNPQDFDLSALLLLGLVAGLVVWAYPYLQFYETWKTGGSIENLYGN
jgi:hypothetical protein